MNVLRFPDPVTAAEACGRHILDLLAEAIAARQRATLAVSGGSSPRPMFELFAKSGFPWEQVHVFWVDERCVPPSDPQSNFRLANETWLAPAKVPADNIHRVPTELEPHAAARQYSEHIRAFFGLKPDELPQFDVIHRGMGPDAHTASLFPGESLIGDRKRTAAAMWVEKMHQWRVTLLPGVLEAARHTVVLATGSDKASALYSVLSEPYDPMRLPAQIAAGKESNATWFVDEAAAALLPDLSKEDALPKERA
ncbi:MAG: 6-phosphogluconolactonase [Bryobacterales bacterium]|nr:6-phosphogluconolactonase [Bryobacterales bacterium]